jgi:hypothetical protein
MSANKRDSFRNAIDKIIETHGKDNPHLLKDLLELREELHQSSKSKYFDYAMFGLRVVSAIKWVFDHLPPPPP